MCFGLQFNNLLPYGFVYFILFHLDVYADKKVCKKAKKMMSNGSNCDRKQQLSNILTEPLNPREGETQKQD